MKTLMRNIMLLVVMVATFSTSSAVAQTLRDASYNYVGKISPNGTVRDSKYNPVGYFNNDGTIANAKGKVVGRFDGKMQIFNKGGERVDGPLQVHVASPRVVARIALADAV